MKIQLLWFMLDENEEQQLLIGLYQSVQEAEAAIERLKDKPGFRDRLHGFQIHGRDVGEDAWSSGYVED